MYIGTYVRQTARKKGIFYSRERTAEGKKKLRPRPGKGTRREIERTRKRGGGGWREEGFFPKLHVVRYFSSEFGLLSPNGIGVVSRKLFLYWNETENEGNGRAFLFGLENSQKKLSTEQLKK